MNAGALQRQSDEPVLEAVASRRSGGLPADLGGGVFAFALTGLLLLYLHREFLPLQALLVSVIAVLARRLGAATWRELPRFLSVPFDLAAIAAIGFLGSAATMLLRPWPYWALRWREAAAILGLAALVGLALAGLTWTHSRMARVVAERETRLAALRQATLAAQLRALQAQINPHFLFNALNSLAELVHEDADEAERFVQDLAHLLRYTLRSSAEGLVPLEQELEATQRYLRLEQARLGERLKLEIDVERAALPLLLPGLALQTLVENAIKHGIAGRTEVGRLRVEGRAEGEDGDELVLRVRDDGPGLPAAVQSRLSGDGDTGSPGVGDVGVGSGGAGGGLNNVQQRMALSYSGGGSLRLIPSEGAGLDGAGTCLELRLPAVGRQA